MTLIQLEYVLAVAKTKNFTLAAQNCFVTQPTLSMQIQKLEKELDIEIFDRSTHPITLTAIGKKVVNHAQNILTTAQKMEHLVNESKQSMQGEITLGIIPTILPTLLPLFYKNFSKKYPKLKLIIKELNTENLLKQLKNETLDFGIAATPLYDDLIIEKPLYYEPLVGFIPKYHSLSSKKKINTNDLLIDDLLLLEEGHCFRNNVLSVCDKSVFKNQKLHLESGSFQALINLCKEGYGITLLPLLHAENLSDKDQQFIKNFSNPIPTREVALLYSHAQIRINFSDKFIKLIQNIIRGKLFLESKAVTSPTLKIS